MLIEDKLPFLIFYKKIFSKNFSTKKKDYEA